MYSPRRFKLYKKKYYKRYGYNIKDIYSPSLYGAPVPNYYQMKGRTIQASPAHMRDVSPFMMNEKKLDEMYKMLVRYKYNFPVQPTPGPSVPVQPFLISTRYYISAFFTEASPVLSRQKFKELLNTYLDNNFHELYTAYPNWNYRLYYLQLQNATDYTLMENWQFHIDWNSNLIQNGPYQIILKTVNNPMKANYVSPTITIQPYSQNQLRAYRLTFLNSGECQQTSTNLNSNDTVFNDQGLYPIIDTEAGDQDIYASQLEWVGDQYPGIGPYVYCVINVLCAPAY